MKNVSVIFLAALCVGLSAADHADPTAEKFRQVYDLCPDKVREYSKQIARDLTAQPQWKDAPAFYYVVPPLSDIPRKPDTFPADGVPCGELQIVAAPGEFEPASIVLAPVKNVDQFTLKATDLKAKSGAVIPASALDIKVVKNWYQAGSAWYGYFADALGRTLVPEMLLNDEDMIRVVPATKDNYVRYANEDGSTSYQWMTANFTVTNYTFSNQANIGLIADAETLQPVVLNKNEFKQFFVTVKVPADAKAGLYRGGIGLTADGKLIGTAPIVVRVLPFTLPEPKTNYDQNKNFYLSLYGANSKNPRILKNMADHNARHPLRVVTVDVFEPEVFEEDVARIKACGIATKPLFSCTESTGLLTDRHPVGAEARALERFRQIIKKTAALTQKTLGHTEFYGYGVDEGGPGTIRRERNAWQATHDSGGKIMVTSNPHRELLFALDYLNLPSAPAPHRIAEIRKFHESNPDAICSWYANPHSGPENPDYFRRLHGFQTYKTNYDLSANYCWWRNNWNDVAIPYEHNLRGLIMVYAGRDQTFDTIAWEGVREGMDDVKYVSYMKTLALEAARSTDGNVKMLGRRILSRLAYLDEERYTLDTLRMECINNILRLRAALKKGN